MFENDYIHAIECKLPPQGSAALSMAGPCLLVPLTPATLSINGKEPTTLDEHDVFWSESGIATLEGVGSSESRVLIAQFKGEAPTTPPAVPDDNAMILEPEAYRLIFENCRARVAWVTSRPGEKTVMHSHPARVFRCVIAPNHLVATDPEGVTHDIKTVAGTAFWREDASAHATENVGDTTGELILIEVR